MSALRLVHGNTADLVAKLRQPKEERGWVPRDPGNELAPFGRKLCPSCKEWQRHRAFTRPIPDRPGADKGLMATRICTPCRQSKNRGRPRSDRVIDAVGNRVVTAM